MAPRILHRTAQLTGFPWTPRRVGGRFRNVGDPWTPRFPDVLRWKFGRGPADTSPRPVSAPIYPAAVAPDSARLAQPDPERIVVTWIGHSTFLIQFAGFNILTDPIFSDYCSPLPLERTRRLVAPALPIRELPRIDLILISHAHYDHFDLPSLQQLDRRIPVACPLGLAAMLHPRGYENAVEFGWGDLGEMKDLRVCCLPVQHGAARTPFDRNATLWCGWMLEIAGRRIFFAGDTGYARYFPEMLARFAPIELALLPIGAYSPAWFMQPVHMNPIEAVEVHRHLGSRVSIAMHWGTFLLADDPPGEPAAVLRDCLAGASIPESEFRTLGIGETLSLLPGVESRSFSQSPATGAHDS